MVSDADNRTYHNDKTSTYSLPNDERESYRLHQQHSALVELMHDDPIHAPVNDLNPRKIVDIGCGVNADMTLLLAKRFPNAQVYGVDLSPVPMPLDQIPPNVEFIQCNMYNLRDDPRIGEGTVDYVFSRFLVAGMDDWNRYIHMVSQLLAPGGLIELQDMTGIRWHNGQGEEVSKQWRWANALNAARPDGPAIHTKILEVREMMQQNGLVDAEKRDYPLWWKATSGKPETEAWAKYCISDFPRSFISSLSRRWPGEENKAVREEYEHEIWETLGKRGDMYHLMIVAWARKPST